MIKSSYFFKSLLEKTLILETGFLNDQLQHDASDQFDPIELFRTFMKYDRNQNGTLDFGEYFVCLTESGLGLSKSEIISMTLAADINGDQEIDFQEFVKHFTTCLDMMSFNDKLQKEFLCPSCKSTNFKKHCE